jgi:phenylacetate-coenzyme A ligase PaaK-like adenylate-forming protein
MPWIHNAVILPLLEPERHRGLERRLRQFEIFDSLSHDEQLQIQEHKVNKILQHAYQTTPYYRRLFDDAGFHAEGWRSGQPTPLPALTRDLVRKNGDGLRSRAIPDAMLRSATTGGTTSVPVRIWRDIEGLRKKTALQFHLNRRSGFDQGDPVLNIWGAERDLALNPSWKWRLYEEVLLRRCNAGAGQLSERVLASFAEKLNRHRPRVIFGYAATIGIFADYLRASGRPFHKPSRLIVTAEPISVEVREKMERIFECPVTEHYGSRDIGMVAAQCDVGHRLHFHPAACYTEFVPAGRTVEGPIYRLVITDLLNRGMPMIRYDTDDCVLLADTPCPCGNWYPSVKKILGRAVDNFTLPDGSLVTGIAVTAAVARIQDGFSYIRQIQLIQKGIQHLHLRYVAEGDVVEIQRELSMFRAEVEKLFQIQVRWTAERVREIQRERSGKIRFCISEVSAPARPVAV